jgi:general secretion pathway protein C
MSSRIVDRIKLKTHLVPIVFMVVSAFWLAHSVNAVVENTLLHSVYQATREKSLQLTEPDSRASQRTNQQFVRDILSSGLFPVPSAPMDATSNRSIAASAGPPLEIAKKVALLGIVMGVTGDERAILEDLSNKRQALYQVSQHIQDVGELVAIEKTRVLFRQGSQEEWLELAIVKQEAAMVPLPRMYQPIAQATPSPPTQARPAVPRTLDRAQLVRLVSSPQAYFSEARFQPHFSGNGTLDGFRVDGIRQVGVLERAGLQNDDVLAAINGVEVRDPGRLWDQFKQLQHERTIRLNVIRQSQPVTLMVDIR